MKISSARNLVMFNFTGLSFLAHVAERHRRAGWVLGLHQSSHRFTARMVTMSAARITNPASTSNDVTVIGRLSRASCRASSAGWVRDVASSEHPQNRTQDRDQQRDDDEASECEDEFAVAALPLYPLSVASGVTHYEVLGLSFCMDYAAPRGVVC